jgi:phosphopantetheine adenylyltransferase/dephospho-CoA kinase
MTVFVGLTGGICSGKSTISKILKDRGIPIVDADQLGHKAYAPGTSCFQKLVDNFGSSIVAEDGSINRRALGAIVFSEKSKMQELNAIVWPEIRQLIIEEIDTFRKETSNVPIVVVEAAIMIEAKWYDLFDQVWVVVTDESTAIQRLISRNSLTEEQARQRLAAQTSNDDRIQHANSVISNDSATTVEALTTTVNELLSSISASSPL